MKIVLYGLNFYPELTGIGKYSGEMVSWLVEKDHSVKVVTAVPYYPEWAVHEGFSRFWFAKEKRGLLSVFRCPLYVPSKPNTLKRLLHLLSFSFSSIFPLLFRDYKKPDVVITVQPTLFCAPFALIYARLFGAKAVMHIQDFELDAMLGLGMMRQGPLSRVLKRTESWLISRFDAVSTISFSMMDNAEKKGVAKEQLIFFPNWADTDFVTPDVSGDQLRRDWGFSNNDRLVLYAGNIGKKQGLEVVLDAAEALKTDQRLKFVLVGSGAHVGVLQQEAEQRGLTNIFFKPLQPWALVPSMLAMADIHLIVQRKGAADVVLPSKLTNILSAGGHALVTAERHTELGMLSVKFPGIYDLVEPESSELFTQSLKNILERDCSAFNKVARQYAVDNLSRDKVLSRFESNLMKLCGQSAK